MSLTLVAVQDAEQEAILLDDIARAAHDEAAEAARRGMTVDEMTEYFEDLCLDADLQG